MTTNDVSARDLQIRTDRPGLRSDWLNGKSHDKFAPMGPYLVPKRLREGPHEAVHPAQRQRRGQAERQHLAVHLHARGADRIRLQHPQPGDRRHLRLRHLRRRRPGHRHVHQCRRCDGDRGRGPGQDAQQIRRRDPSLAAKRRMLPFVSPRADFARLAVNEPPTAAAKKGNPPFDARAVRTDHRRSAEFQLPPAVAAGGCG